MHILLEIITHAGVLDTYNLLAVVGGSVIPIVFSALHQHE
jgi:hypothetical protein